MTTLQVLRKARALIKKGWTQGAFARRKNGHTTEDDSAAAVKFCVRGAINRVARFGEWQVASKCLQDALDDPWRSLVEFNDAKGRKRAEVVALFDRAIKACK